MDDTDLGVDEYAEHTDLGLQRNEPDTIGGGDTVLRFLLWSCVAAVVVALAVVGFLQLIGVAP